MAFTPAVGSLAILQAAAAPSGTPATLPGMNWSLAIDSNVVDISNFLVGRYPAATLENTELSFTLVWDSGAQPHLTPSFIDAGLDILVKLFVDTTKFYSGRFTVATVGPGVESLENVVMYAVTAKIKGTLTRPV